MAAPAIRYEDIEDAVLHLSRPERSRLAMRLLESLDETGEEEVSEEWLAELRRRVRDIEEGKTELIPSEEVWKRIDDRFVTQFSG